eukprot:TRINITY_DN31897_c0_g1_i1.p1 TRINITY_DN31897_c0_g1~~TRINITY_DN31897_c0_g1_i1.p1  ORF type:complete len:234 (+),score=27.70 TRINITY_DN31897_c0_g1_i1:39-704(+)
MIRRTGRFLYPMIVRDKTKGPHGEAVPLRNQGSDLDDWLWLTPELRPEQPTDKGYTRTRPYVPRLCTSRLSLRHVKELSVKFCPFLVGGDESVNGNVQSIMEYLVSEDCRMSNPKTIITIETTNTYMPPQYTLHFNSGVTRIVNEWSGAHQSEVIQAMARLEYEETAEAIARDENIDYFHFDKHFEQGLIAFPYVFDYNIVRPLRTDVIYKRRMEKWRVKK